MTGLIALAAATDNSPWWDMVNSAAGPAFCAAFLGAVIVFAQWVARKTRPKR